MNTAPKIDKRFNKRSLMATNVANEVLEKIKNKQPINLRKIQVGNGYTDVSARSGKAIQTKTFKDIVYPVLKRMESIRLKGLVELDKKDLSQEKYNVLIDGMDKLTKNIQLLSGKATENVAQNIVVFGSDDFMQQQIDKNKSDNKQ